MRLRALSVLALFAASPLAAQQASDLPADYREARTALRTALTGFDAPAAARWFAEDAVVDFAGQVISGLPAIREAWLPGMMADLTALSLEDGTFTVEAGTITETAQHVATTVEGPQAGSHRLTWRKTDDGWRVTRLEVF